MAPNNLKLPHAEENVANRLGSRIIECHGEKEISICFGGGGNRTWITGLVGRRSPTVLAGPGRDLFIRATYPIRSEGKYFSFFLLPVDGTFGVC